MHNFSYLLVYLYTSSGKTVQSRPQSLMIASIVINNQKGSEWSSRVTLGLPCLVTLWEKNKTKKEKNQCL